MTPEEVWALKAIRIFIERYTYVPDGADHPAHHLVDDLSDRAINDELQRLVQHDRLAAASDFARIVADMGRPSRAPSRRRFLRIVDALDRRDPIAYVRRHVLAAWEGGRNHQEGA